MHNHPMPSRTGCSSASTTQSFLSLPLTVTGAYPDLMGMPSFIAQQRQQYVPETAGTSADPEQPQGRPLETYTVVQEHFEGKMARDSDWTRWS